jgi:hypothetical protein
LRRTSTINPASRTRISAPSIQSGRPGMWEPIPAKVGQSSRAGRGGRALRSPGPGRGSLLVTLLLFCAARGWRVDAEIERGQRRRPGHRGHDDHHRLSRRTAGSASSAAKAAGSTKAAGWKGGGPPLRRDQSAPRRRRKADPAARAWPREWRW